MLKWVLRAALRLVAPPDRWRFLKAHPLRKVSSTSRAFAWHGQHARFLFDASRMPAMRGPFPRLEWRQTSGNVGGQKSGRHAMKSISVFLLISSFFEPVSQRMGRNFRQEEITDLLLFRKPKKRGRRTKRIVFIPILFARKGQYF